MGTPTSWTVPQSVAARANVLGHCQSPFGFLLLCSDFNSSCTFGEWPPPVVPAVGRHPWFKRLVATPFKNSELRTEVGFGECVCKFVCLLWNERQFQKQFQKQYCVVRFPHLKKDGSFVTGRPCLRCSQPHFFSKNDYHIKNSYYHIKKLLLDAEVASERRSSQVLKPRPSATDSK